MCGLVGMAGDLNNNHDKVMKMLLVLDSLRGEDSTGVAFVRKYASDDTAVAKALGDPFNLFNDSKFINNMNRQNRVFIGHNRYATVGGISKSSAHPFDFDTLIGVHNGTLGSKYQLQDHMDYKVDSQALYHNIEVNGLKPTIDRLGGHNNAWSLVWWDKKDNTLNFLRNKERPLYMCRSEDGKVLFWASEPWMLHVSLSRNGIKHGDVFQTEEDVHYSVEVKRTGELCKPKLARVAAPIPYVAPVVHQQRPAHIPHNSRSNVVQLPSNATAGTTATSKGVVDQKKPGDSNASKLDLSYINKDKRIFEILSENIDGSGGHYISLFDPKRPYVDIRLYPRKQDTFLFHLVGEDIEGSIGAYDLTDRKAIRGYYKVAPDSVAYIAPVVKEAPKGDAVKDALQKELDEAFAAVTEEDEEKYINHRGHFVTAEQWKRSYGVCEWCSDLLQPQNRNRFTTAGQCVCEGCAKNPEVAEYVNLI